MFCGDEFQSMVVWSGESLDEDRAVELWNRWPRTGRAVCGGEAEIRPGTARTGDRGTGGREEDGLTGERG